MVRLQLKFKSEDPGFDLLVGQGEGQFFCPSELNSCADLFALDSPACVWYAPKCVRVKEPISICRKRVGLTSGAMETRKTQHTLKGGRKKKLGSATLIYYYGYSLSPGKDAQISCVLHWDKKLESYLNLN